MTSSKAFLAAQVETLSTSLRAPADATQAEKKAVTALEADLAEARKPLLQPEILTQILEQLDILAVEDRAKRQRIDRKIQRDDGKFPLAVDANDVPAQDWLDGLPDVWPDAAKTVKGKAYAALLKRVRDLDRRRGDLELQRERLESLFDLLGAPEQIQAALPGGDPGLLALAKELAKSQSS